MHIRARTHTFGFNDIQYPDRRVWWADEKGVEYVSVATSKMSIEQAKFLINR